MRISLIIPTFKREKDLVECLKCAFHQNYPDYEVIVVDDTPVHEPETAEFLKANQSRMKLLKTPKPSSSRARNFGAANSTGDILVVIDDDTTFANDFLTQHANALAKGYDLIQGRVLENGSKIYSKPIWINWLGAFSGGDTCLTDGPTNNITSCNFSATRAAWNRIGGFDERFVETAMHEDSDFGYRAYKLNLKLHFSAKAELFHHRVVTGGVANRARYIYLESSMLRNKFYFYRKNFGWPAVAYQFIWVLNKGVRHYFRMARKANQDATAMMEN